VAAAALAARFALQQWGGVAAGGEAPAGSSSSSSPSSSSSASASSSSSAPPPDAAAASHKTFGATYWARTLYKGGFEDKMSRKEASLILGVRESADPKRVQERHRKMLVSNHPDMGGSAFIAMKVNEARDVLLRGSKQ